ncbi:hypothetical protein [Corynebacterium aquilae]|uniref:hypothetical protein n=1 Tax=Corynebacterium aquilae TaxID=203263 RepID=UPI001474B30B|nr:hypothetical protein [Corynebacterium aquilae]
MAGFLSEYLENNGHVRVDHGEELLIIADEQALVAEPRYPHSASIVVGLDLDAQLADLPEATAKILIHPISAGGPLEFYVSAAGEVSRVIVELLLPAPLGEVLDADVPRYREAQRRATQLLNQLQLVQTEMALLSQEFRSIDQ